MKDPTSNLPPPTSHVPLFRFSTGHELWRVLSAELLHRWKEEAVPSRSGLRYLDLSSQTFFLGIDEQDLDRGVFALMRDGLPLRLLFLEEGSFPFSLQIRLRPALPGHPKEDPTTGLQIFHWFSFLSFREPVFSPNEDLTWLALGGGPVDWTVEFLIHDDTEIRTFLLAAMPWVLPRKLFIEWLDSSIFPPVVATPSDNG